MARGAANIRLWRIPDTVHEDLKQAFEKRAFFYIIKVWNQYDVYPGGICAACPDSVKLVRKHTPDLWANEQSSE